MESRLEKEKSGKIKNYKNKNECKNSMSRAWNLEKEGRAMPNWGVDSHAPNSLISTDYPLFESS